MPIKRILIVDDQHEIRQVLRAALMTLPARMEVTDAPSGEEAMLIISLQSFDLLVIDIRLVGLSGLELMQQVKKRNPAIKMILMTGSTEEALREQIIGAKPDAYFYKPIEIPEFLEMVMRLLGEHTVPQRNFDPDISTHQVNTVPTSEAVEAPIFEQKNHLSEASTTGDDGTAKVLEGWISKIGVKALACFDDQGRVYARAGDSTFQSVLSQFGDFVSRASKLAQECPDSGGSGCAGGFGGWFVDGQLLLWSGNVGEIHLVGLAQRDFFERFPHGFSLFREAACQVAEVLKKSGASKQTGVDQEVAEPIEDDLQNSENEAGLGDLASILAAPTDDISSEADAFWDAATSQMDYE
ncbi:MAG TPA: response regulator, partial [Anaerolineales bacterium]|nr:response regulator [Anaerolineales bacterium]